MGMQRTALRARKIGAFLKSGIGPSAFPIYQCAAADAQTVGPQTRSAFNIICALIMQSYWQRAPDENPYSDSPDSAQSCSTIKKCYNCEPQPETQHNVLPDMWSVFYFPRWHLILQTR